MSLKIKIKEKIKNKKSRAIMKWCLKRVNNQFRIERGAKIFLLLFQPMSLTFLFQAFSWQNHFLTFYNFITKRYQKSSIIKLCLVSSYKTMNIAFNSAKMNLLCTIAAKINYFSAKVDRISTKASKSNFIHKIKKNRVWGQSISILAKFRIINSIKMAST